MDATPTAHHRLGGSRLSVDSDERSRIVEHVVAILLDEDATNGA